MANPSLFAALDEVVKHFSGNPSRSDRGIRINLLFDTATGNIRGDVVTRFSGSIKASAEGKTTAEVLAGLDAAFK